MGKKLTDQQIAHYHEHGYCSPIDLMSGNEADRFGQRLEQAERDYPEAVNPYNRNNAHLAFTFADELAFNETVLDAVEDLLGPNVLLWGSVLFIKEPQSAGYVSWHQDATYMGLEPTDFVTPWIALTASNLHNGCMSVIPGSHKQGIRPHEDTFDDDNILTRGQRLDGVDESLAVHFELRPGQMSQHHCCLVHGSQPNRSKERRIGVALQAYIAPHVRQVVGEHRAQLARGIDPQGRAALDQRPRYDMEAKAAANRELANKNFADILYQGAAQNRRY